MASGMYPHNEDVVIMIVEEMTAKELKTAIQSRVSWLKRVVGFVRDLTNRQDKLLQHDQGSPRTHTVRELRNFENFSFEVDLQQGMRGGNEVKVWYQPPLSDIPTAEYYQPVLHLKYRGVEPDENDEVKVFSIDPDWQRALEKLMLPIDGGQAKEDKEKVCRHGSEQDKPVAKLREQATNLKI